MEECIKACLACHRTCLQMAMSHCLKAGGKHTEPQHFVLMMACVEICQTSARLMLMNCDLHTKTCGACAEICAACADSCEAVGDMEECVKTCRACAETCGRMAG